MNSYALAAMAAIQQYHKEHDTYPPCVEAAPEYIEMMGYMYFEFTEPIPDTQSEQCTRVPVVEVGTGDIVFRRLLVKNIGIKQEQANCATNEEFQKIGAKLARAGLTIVEPKRMWGIHNYPPPIYYSQIEVWVFGEWAVLREVISESFNHSSEG
jgi:hypothetical protein